MIRSKLVALPIALLALAVFAVPAAAFKHHVTIKGSLGLYHFKPKTITITKGQSVHWSWSSDSEHNVTFTKLGGKHSKTAASVSNFKVTFKKAGTFKYTCTVHGFAGKVVVQKP